MRRVAIPWVAVLTVTAWLTVGCASGTPAVETVCGDGLVEGDEACDDGNLELGDGCDKDCAAEVGWACTGVPSVCGGMCGDGIRVGGETCDGEDVGGVTCEALQLGSGMVTCDATTCELNTSGCSGEACGNGEIDTDFGEQCDGANVGSLTCAGEGYDGGTLACTSACAIDTSGCTLNSCGNGIVEGVEECDDANLSPGDGCGANCAVEDGWVCVGQPSVCALLCGNGALDPGEQCDGAALGGQTCVSLGMGYEGGTLACAAGCTFDTSGCELPSCGNGALDPNEQCDGILLDGQTCETVGSFIGGTLLCSASCSFDLTNCIPILCGDGIISTGEACDDGNTTGGDGCNILCNVESGWECSGEPSSCSLLCGNNQLDSGEQCDGPLLGGATCLTQGYDTGNLACTMGCLYDTTGCSMFTCGDGQVTGLEDCDGANLDGETCLTLGFVGGSLSCTGNCGFDTTSCIAPSCGDGIISAGEQCDDQNTTSGDGCNAACQVENGWICSGTPSACQLSCGNNVADPGEDCDGGDLGGGTCQTQGFPGGTLSCNANCTYNTSACLDSVCPNGVREGTEECDGSDFGAQDCTSYGYTGGSLACTAGCTIDTSGCSNQVCGNSAVETGEECDDGNVSSGDGCSSTCQWEQTCTADDTISCGGSDTTWTFSGNDASGYSCSGSGSSAERIYQLNIGTGVTSVTADLYCWDMDDDYDLFVMEGACNPGLCIASATGSWCDLLTFNVQPNTTYYIAVEEYWGSWNNVELDISCN